MTLGLDKAVGMAVVLTSVMGRSSPELTRRLRLPTSLPEVYRPLTNTPVWPDFMVAMNAPGKRLRLPIMFTLMPSLILVGRNAIMGSGRPTVIMAALIVGSLPPLAVAFRTDWLLRISFARILYVPRMSFDASTRALRATTLSADAIARALRDPFSSR